MRLRGKCSSGLNICSDIGRVALAALTFLLASYLVRAQQQPSGSAYEHWEQFKQRLGGPLAALLEVYAPSWFSRVGLRYQDLVRRSVLNLADRPWSTLLKQPITGLLSAPDLRATIAQTLTQTLIELADDRGSVNLRHGLVQAADPNEICYLIDNDHQAVRAPASASQLLSVLNGKSPRNRSQRG